MAMTPQERMEFDMLKQTVERLWRVEDVPFIQNLNRRISVDGAQSAKSATSENITVNESGAATHTVLGAPDGFISIGGRNVPYFN